MRDRVQEIDVASGRCESRLLAENQDERARAHQYKVLAESCEPRLREDLQLLQDRFQDSDAYSDSSQPQLRREVNCVANLRGEELRECDVAQDGETQLHQERGLYWPFHDSEMARPSMLQQDLENSEGLTD